MLMVTVSADLESGLNIDFAGCRDAGVLSRHDNSDRLQAGLFFRSSDERQQILMLHCFRDLIEKRLE